MDFDDKIRSGDQLGNYYSDITFSVMIEVHNHDSLTKILNWIQNRSKIPYSPDISLTVEHIDKATQTISLRSRSSSSIRQARSFAYQIGLSISPSDGTPPLAGYRHPAALVRHAPYDHKSKMFINKQINQVPPSLGNLGLAAAQQSKWIRSSDYAPIDSGHNFSRSKVTHGSIPTQDKIRRTMTNVAPQEKGTEFIVSLRTRSLQIGQAIQAERQLQVALNHQVDNLRINYSKLNSQFAVDRILEEAIYPRPELSFSQQQEMMLLSYMKWSLFDNTVLESEVGKASGKRKPSPVVYVKGFDRETVSLEQLTRVFQCFGKVEKSMIHTKKEYALIQFADIRHSKTSIKGLYGAQIGGRNLLIHYSEFKELNNRFYTNEKVYFQPNMELPLIVEVSGSVLASPIVTVKIHALPGSELALSSSDMTNQILPLSAINVNVNKVAQNELRIEFASVNAALDFAKDNNYRELKTQGAFSLVSFATA